MFHGKSFTWTNWQAIISTPCLRRLADASKELQRFCCIYGPMILARRALTPNCAKKYELKFTPSKLPETEPVKELKKTVCTSCQQFAGTFDAFLNVKLSTNSSWPKHFGLFVKGILSISLPGFDGHRLFCERSSLFCAKSTFLCPCRKWKYEFACVTNVIHAFPNAWEPIITPKRFANMTVEKRKTEKRMKRQESYVFIYAYPFSPHTKTGKCCTSWD